MYMAVEKSPSIEGLSNPAVLSGCSVKAAHVVWGDAEGVRLSPP